MRCIWQQRHCVKHGWIEIEGNEWIGLEWNGTELYVYHKLLNGTYSFYLKGYFLFSKESSPVKSLQNIFHVSGCKQPKLLQLSGYVGLGQIFLLVDLRDFFSDLGSGGRKKINKKALKIFIFFFFFHFQRFLKYLQKKTVKLVRLTNSLC